CGCVWHDLSPGASLLPCPLAVAVVHLGGVGFARTEYPRMYTNRPSWPAPAVAPEVVLREPPPGVLDHHEPDLDVRVPGGLSGRESLRSDIGDVLDQHRAVREFAIPAVRLDVLQPQVDLEGPAKGTACAAPPPACSRRRRRRG